MKIVVIGVGSAGSAVVEKLHKENIQDEVTFALVDSNSISLKNSAIKAKVFIGDNVRGFGGDESPQKYKKNALEKYDEIKKVIF